MKKPQIILLLLLTAHTLFSQQEKIIGDCTVTYIINNTENNAKNYAENVVKTVYMRGKQIRVDLNSNTFNQTIFYNDNTGEATVLKSMGESKYISTYTAVDWQRQNAIYNGIKVSFTNNTKRILNYTCKEAVLQLTNGNTYTVYYVPDLLPSVTENAFEFKDVPGIILQYQISIHDQKIQYTASKINFDPVPVFKFDIPASGYKILN